MKKIILLALLVTGISCEFSSRQSNVSPAPETKVSKDTVNRLLDNWHLAAAHADFEKYFAFMSDNGIFIGTDAMENWQNKEFREYSKPYFEKGQAWNFTALERTIYSSSNSQTVWFDELLSTQMGLCRGSGVLEMENGSWKIKHYVLSVVIPNTKIPEITAIKKEFDSSYISRMPLVIKK